MNNPWNKKHECCILCGTKRHKHKAHGMCSHCYQSHYYSPELRREKYLKQIGIEDKKPDNLSKCAGSTEPDIKPDGFYKLVARWMTVQGIMKRGRAKVLKLCAVKDAVGTLFYQVVTNDERQAVEYWPANECEFIGYWR